MQQSFVEEAMLACSAPAPPFLLAERQDMWSMQQLLRAGLLLAWDAESETCHVKVSTDTSPRSCAPNGIVDPLVEFEAMKWLAACSARAATLLRISVPPASLHEHRSSDYWQVGT